MRNVVSTLRREKKSPRPSPLSFNSCFTRRWRPGVVEDDNSIMAKTVFDIAGLK
jgi:hypothetical protein